MSERDGQGMRFVYGAPAAPPRKVEDLKLGPDEVKAIEESLVEAGLIDRPSPKIDDPPPTVPDAEFDAINALAKLDPVTRLRVLRWAVSKWGPT